MFLKNKISENITMHKWTIPKVPWMPSRRVATKHAINFRDHIRQTDTMIFWRAWIAWATIGAPYRMCLPRDCWEESRAARSYCAIVNMTAICSQYRWDPTSTCIILGYNTLKMVGLGFIRFVDHGWKSKFSTLFFEGRFILENFSTLGALDLISLVDTIMYKSNSGLTFYIESKSSGKPVEIGVLSFLFYDFDF